MKISDYVQLAQLLCDEVNVHTWENKYKDDYKLIYNNKQKILVLKKGKNEKRIW